MFNNLTLKMPTKYWKRPGRLK